VSGVYGALRVVDQEDDTLIIAHRGGAAVAPENTQSAFERGMADGADWLELDVQEDAEGRIIVVHDRDFMRVAGSPMEVAEATVASLADLDIGSFFDAEFAFERAPTLREVLERVDGRATVLVELKYYGRQRHLEERVIQVIEEAGATGYVVLMSMNHEGIGKVANLRPAWTCGVLNAVMLGDITSMRTDFFAVTAKVGTRSFIARAHRRGKKVYVWTVNDPVQMSLMISRGADGLITDEVGMVGSVIAVREQISPLGRILIWLAAESGLLRGADFSSPASES
jgi:glycerophosphoryl diester phosphodiesterase